MESGFGGGEGAVLRRSNIDTRTASDWTYGRDGVASRDNRRLGGSGTTPGRKRVLASFGLNVLAIVKFRTSDKKLIAGGA